MMLASVVTGCERRAEAGRPAWGRAACPSTLSAHPFVSCFVLNQSPHSLLLSGKQRKGGAASLGGASRPGTRPKNFENFCELLMVQNFQILNMCWLKLKHDYAGWKENYARKNLNYPICNANDGYVPRTSWRGLRFCVRSRTLHSFGLIVVAGWSLGR
jgi:hypothetical protein